MQQSEATDRKEDRQYGVEKTGTDPDSRILRRADGYVQGYNAQAAVDESLIEAAAVTSSAGDAAQAA